MKVLIVLSLFLISQASFAKGSLSSKVIERSLLKKPIEFVKKTGVSVVLACSLTFTGCGVPVAVDPVTAVLMPPVVIGTAVDLLVRGHYPDHKHESHVGFESRNGVLWHVHSTGWYKNHGYLQYKGVHLSLGDDNFRDYKSRKPYFTSSDYHEVEVLVKEGELYREGLAIKGLSPDTVTLLIGGTSHEKSYTVGIDDIVGVRITHYSDDYIGNDSVVFVQNDILPFEHSIYTPEEMSDKVLGLTASRGEIIKLFSNGMSLLWDPNYETNVLVKSGVAGW